MTQPLPKMNFPMPVWATLVLGLIFVVLSGPGLSPEKFPSLAAAFPVFAHRTAGLLCLLFGVEFILIYGYLMRNAVRAHHAKHGLPPIENRGRLLLGIGIAWLAYVLFLAYAIPHR